MRTVNAECFFSAAASRLPSQATAAIDSILRSARPDHPLACGVLRLDQGLSPVIFQSQSSKMRESSPIQIEQVSLPATNVISASGIPHVAAFTKFRVFCCSTQSLINLSSCQQRPCTLLYEQPFHPSKPLGIWSILLVCVSSLYHVSIAARIAVVLLR